LAPGEEMWIFYCFRKKCARRILTNGASSSTKRCIIFWWNFKSPRVLLVLLSKVIIGPLFFGRLSNYQNQTCRKTYCRILWKRHGVERQVVKRQVVKRQVVERQVVERQVVKRQVVERQVVERQVVELKICRSYKLSTVHLSINEPLSLLVFIVWVGDKSYNNFQIWGGESAFYGWANFVAKVASDEKIRFCHTPLVCDGEGPGQGGLSGMEWTTVYKPILSW
jgi:hypothetical protein